MNVDFDVSDVDNCKVIISELNTREFDELRIVLYQLFQYKEGSTVTNPFGLKKLIEQTSTKGE